MLVTIFGVVMVIVLLLAVFGAFGEQLIQTKMSDEDREYYRWAKDIQDIQKTGKMGTRSEFSKKYQQEKH